MSRTVFLFVCREYLKVAGGIFVALVAVFLVGDFVDRAKAYTGEDWISAVAELYAYKALVSGHQLAPAALLLGAGAAVSGLRKRGELTALQSLGFPPRAVLLPIGACAMVLCLGLVAFDELVVVDASRKVEEITVNRFKRWGDWRFYFFPKQWFRRGPNVFHLRAGDVEHGFQNVTVLTLREDFTLARRLDAGLMEAMEGNTWRMRDVIERNFARDGAVTVRTPVEAEYDLGADAAAFRIQVGRPEHMRTRQLREQVIARRRGRAPDPGLRARGAQPRGLSAGRTPGGPARGPAGDARGSTGTPHRRPRRGAVHRHGDVGADGGVPHAGARRAHAPGARRVVAHAAVERRDAVAVGAAQRRPGAGPATRDAEGPRDSRGLSPAVGLKVFQGAGRGRKRSLRNWSTR